jgi:hypothetical protein
MSRICVEWRKAIKNKKQRLLDQFLVSQFFGFSGWFGCGSEFQNGIVPQWETVTDLGLGEDFVGLGLGRSSILGIAGDAWITPGLRFRVDESLLR